MKYKTIFVIAMVVGIQGLFAQASLDTLLKLVSENNRKILAAEQLYQAESIAAKVGNSPPNPQVEYGYMWGTPDFVGERIDFAVTQSFDFPSTYTSQSKLVRISQNQAELKWKATRQEVLLAAHKAWIQDIHLNIRKALLEDRLEQANMVQDASQQKYERGEANALDLNQVRLKTALLKSDLQRTLVALRNNEVLIRQMTNGSMVSISGDALPETKDIVLDSLLAHYDVSPMNRWFDQEVSRREQQADVVFNRKLPKLTAGYYSEQILNTHLRGFKAGITIPLWGNAHAVKGAQAGQAFAESDAWRFHTEQQSDVVSTYYEYMNLKKQVDEIYQVIRESNNEALLLDAIDAGEMSVTQYFYESGFFFQTRLALLDTQRDVLLLEAQLTKIYR